MAGASPHRGAAPTAEQNLAQWWTVFNDPQLTSLVERGMQANLDLRMAESRIRQARASMGIAGADLGPTVNTAASLTRSRTPASSSRSEVVTGNLYQMGFDAGWEIDLFGGLRRGVEAAGADLDAAVESRQRSPGEPERRGGQQLSQPALPATAAHHCPPEPQRPGAHRRSDPPAL